ncbi:MAG: hypothetical protein IKE30_11155 [Clostridia bacterium]|nr:hypothetical protein [Clostridia bacterium]
MDGAGTAGRTGEPGGAALAGSRAAAGGIAAGKKRGIASKGVRQSRADPVGTGLFFAESTDPIRAREAFPAVLPNENRIKMMQIPAKSGRNPKTGFSPGCH